MSGKRRLLAISNTKYQQQNQGQKQKQFLPLICADER